MDAVEFVLSKKRLCEGHFCSGCILHKLCGNENSNRAIAEQIVTKVEQWAKDHPAKTRQSEFLKMFPNALLDGEKIIHIYPCSIDVTIKCQANDKINCHDCRCGYWLQEVD